MTFDLDVNVSIVLPVVRQRSKDWRFTLYANDVSAC